VRKTMALGSFRCNVDAGGYDFLSQVVDGRIQ
jgi:hypothetical protein